VHDAARPCLADAWISAVVDEATRSGAAILAVPVASTLKEARPSRQIARTVSRENLWEAQTPQVFRRELLLQAYAQRGESAATDDAQLVERVGHAVMIVPGSPLNLKITTREDLRLAEQVLKVLPKPRPGGVAHPFADDRWR
jgi:2-C-methyl-D-erythritol 4-phosphate cytidylyltransferase